MAIVLKKQILNTIDLNKNNICKWYSIDVSISAFSEVTRYGVLPLTGLTVQVESAHSPFSARNITSCRYSYCFENVNSYITVT